MQRPTLVIALSVFLSVAVSLLIVTALKQPATLPPADRAIVATQPSAAVTSEELDALRSALDELAMEVARLRQQRESDSRRVAEVEVAGSESEQEPEWAAMLDLDPGRRKAFRAEVADVLTAIEEEREAERWQKELEERRQEAVKANDEYAAFDSKLETRLGELQDKLYLGAGQTDDLRSILAVQNERNREMTRLWSEGNTSKEELGKIFADNRATHRSEVTALLGPDQLGAYRKYLRGGGLGPRFSFFVAPRENWVKQ